MTNPNWPLTKTQIAFGAAPNDPAAVPSYTDVSERVRSLDYDYGRQYETDTNQSGEASLVMSDRDEHLNPGNPSSPYAPLKLYRRLIDQAMWPPQPVGGATNLLWGQGIDPSFESYTAGSLPSWVTQIGITGAQISTVSPFAGTQDLFAPLSAGSTVQGVSMTVTCIPGQTYTASVYARLSVTNTVQISVGATTGTSLSTASVYTRLSVTFTATAVQHQIVVQTVGTVAAGNLRLDNVQVEPGATATTFAASGPTIYGVFNGYIERWPSSWDFNGTYGLAEITCIDQMAILEKTDLHTELVNAILAKQPDYYWPLSEPDGAALFGEGSGNGGPLLTRIDSPAGAGTLTGGTSTDIPGDPNGVGVAVAGGDHSLSGTPTGSSLRTAQPVATGGSGATWAATVAAWVTFVSGEHGPIVVLARSTQRGIYMRLEVLDISPRQVEWSVFTPGGSGISVGHAVTSGDIAAYLDGNAHLVVAAASLVSGNLIETLWIDGVQVATQTTSATAIWGTATPDLLCDTVWVAGQFDGFGGETGYQGTYADVAVWTRALTGTEVADLWNGGQGYPGELSGARIARYLSYGYIGATTIDAGMSTMGVGTVSADTSLLGACQDVATSENGNLYADGSGAVVFRSRADRYLKTTAKWVLGEQENPYEQGITFDFDPTRVFNDVSVTRSGGATTRVVDSDSIKTNFRSTFDRTINVQSDLEATDCANYLLSQMKQPRQRVAGVQLKPSANPALWPVALGAQIGDRVTVKRRTSAGVTISGDFFIEKIAHSRKAGEWVVAFELSPAPVSQVWVLDDPNYSILDATTVLAY